MKLWSHSHLLSGLLVSKRSFPSRDITFKFPPNNLQFPVVVIPYVTGDNRHDLTPRAAITISWHKYASKGKRWRKDNEVGFVSFPLCTLNPDSRLRNRLKNGGALVYWQGTGRINSVAPPFCVCLFECLSQSVLDGRPAYALQEIC